MKRTPWLLVLALCLPLTSLLIGEVEAAKGRSYSSGGGSVSRGSSSGFSRSSGGGSSSPRSSGRSYSSGSRSTPTPTFHRPAASSFDSAAAAAQRKQESKKAFEVRKTSTSNTTSRPPYNSFPASPPPPWRVPVGRSYSAGNNAPRGAATKPAGGTFDSAAAAAQRREESKAVFTQATKPRPTYKAPDGETRPLDAADKRVQEIRRDTDPNRWATRTERRHEVYPNPVPTPVIIYHDPYSNWFWWWLLTQDLNTRALWAYHHHNDMDAARYRELLAKDQQLEARLHELEAQKVPRDPTYAPPGLDRDLMYDDGFVEAAINPQPPQPPPPLPPSRRLGGALWRILLILAIMAFLVWLVFIKRWGGD